MTKRKQSEGIPPPREGRFAYEGLDRVLHEKARLSIMTSLTTQSEGLAFSDLRMLCALSDGNLNRHLTVLREAGFVRIEKQGRGRSSHSLCQVTDTGRAAFLQYLRELERVLADAAATAETPAHINRASRTGWSTI